MLELQDYSLVEQNETNVVKIIEDSLKTRPTLPDYKSIIIEEE